MKEMPELRCNYPWMDIEDHPRIELPRIPAEVASNLQLNSFELELASSKHISKKYSLH